MWECGSTFQSDSSSRTRLKCLRDPKDNSRVKDRLDYYIWLAKLAEKGKITSIFFADTYAGHETYGNDMAATFRGGSQVAQMDPVVFISAMAAVTQSVAFGVTGSTSYLTPYILARTWSTLDHVTNGRIAWNVVTSYSNSAAQGKLFSMVICYHSLGWIRATSNPDRESCGRFSSASKIAPRLRSISRTFGISTY